MLMSAECRHCSCRYCESLLGGGEYAERGGDLGKASESCGGGSYIGGRGVVGLLFALAVKMEKLYQNIQGKVGEAELPTYLAVCCTSR